MERRQEQKVDRKKVTERDVDVLSKALENVTVTQSGMLRVMSYQVENPDIQKRNERIAAAVEQTAIHTAEMNKKIDSLIKEIKSQLSLKTE